MGVPKFYRVLRGQRGNLAKQTYIDYLERLGPTDEDSKVGQGGARPEFTLLYLEPFSIDLGTTIVLQSSALAPSWNAVKSFAPVSTRTKEAVPGTKTAIKLGRGTAARVRASRSLLATGVEKTSKKTKLHYLSYGGNSISFPIGRANDTDTVFEALGDIKVSLVGANFKRVGLIDENL